MCGSKISPVSLDPVAVPRHTIDEVVFARKGDLSLLGARTLEGLNLLVDAKKKKLVAGGPLFAA